MNTLVYIGLSMGCAELTTLADAKSAEHSQRAAEAVVASSKRSDHFHLSAVYGSESTLATGERFGEVILAEKIQE